ncbi:MAG: ATP-binding protein [Paramuribaculum sp.]|nr:ATP-binding protein [Paramuribaculum sp.]
MKRSAIKDLVKWKESPRRKPLIIEGARQVGKTWLVKEFAAKYYKNLAYINFEELVYMRSLFETDFDVTRIISAVSAATHQNCIPGETLIFFDEIQEAANGITALKYFRENAPEQHVIAAGSLLGLELHKQISFPVGKVQFMTLYPMSFMEFLDAIGEAGLVEFIVNDDNANMTLFASKLKTLLKEYYYVGGMPEAVLYFSQTRDWNEVRAIQKEILESYDRDFSKHAPEPIVPRIRQLWNSLPSQLSRENRKFVYGLIKEGARAREYEIALQWLFDGGLIYKVPNVKAPRIPLKSYEDNGAFKIFMLDIGLLGAMSDLDSNTIVNGNAIFTEFKGALTEQYVLQQLTIRHEPFYYSKANSRQEIDFLIQKNGEVIPIEVKAEENLRAKSLHMFVDEFASQKAYRISMSDYRDEGWLTNLPLYAVDRL